VAESGIDPGQRGQSLGDGDDIEMIRHLSITRTASEARDPAFVRLGCAIR
jgi:hypothetical protein